MRNYSIDRQITLVICFLAVGIFLLLFSRANKERSIQRGLELSSYEALPSAEKMATRYLVSEIALADPGDFIIRKDGRVLRIKSVSRDHSGHIELHVYSSTRVETFFLLREIVVWAVVERFVKQTNPDAGALALKFLNQ